jgi:hemolysin activation/secretion protein
MRITAKLLPLALLALSQNLPAQQIPDAGSQLNQLPPPAFPQQAGPQIKIEEAPSPRAPSGPSVHVVVNALQFTGAHVFSSAELLTIAKFTPGAELSLADLQAMAARITERYRHQGYFVARAYLPAQDISNHLVTIAISEGRYGKVTLHNHSRLSDELVNDDLEGIHTGDVITIKPLEHRLLLLSDIPGVKVTSTLVPGESPGSSDLIVDVAPGRRITGLVFADNAGNPYTGEYRVGAQVNFNNPFGHGDVASARVMTSGSGLKYGRLSYQMQFGRATAGVAYSKLEYELGKQFEVLGAHGTAEVASVYGFMPLIRSRDSNLYVGLGYDDKRFDDRMDLIPAANREARARVANISLYGNHRDGIGLGGYSTFFIALSAGSFDIRTPSALAADAASARTDGGYSKLWFNATHLQPLSGSWSLYGSVTGQFASSNLDSSEKFILGGMDGIRAYPQGEGFGDEGVMLTLEARYLLAGLSGRVPGQVHLLGFIDDGKVIVNKDPWFAGDNDRRLSSYGVGVTWDEPGDFAVRAYYARKLGSELAQSAPDRSGRFWIQAVKYF